MQLAIPSPTIAGYKLSPIQLIGGILIIAVGGFFLYKKLTGPKTSGAPMVAVAPDVQFAVSPSNITPNVPATIIGRFQDAQGNPVTVAQGYYYVFILDSSNNRRLISQGSLGMNISTFNTTINTNNWLQGKYNIVCTDIPLSPADLLGSGVSLTSNLPVAGQVPQYQQAPSPQAPYIPQGQLPSIPSAAPPAPPMPPGAAPPGFPVAAPRPY